MQESKLGFGERAGSGLSLIDATWKENNWISPSIEEGHNPDRTTLILITQKDYTKNYTNILNDIQITIIELISKNPRITAKQISKEISNISIPGIKWNLEKLKSKGIIKREGTPRGGYWIIKE